MKATLNDLSFLEECLEGAYVVNRNRRIIFWNKKAEAITGFLADEVVGKSCHDNILNHVDECGTQLCIEGCPLSQTMKDGKTREANVFLHHKQGYRKPVVVKSLPFFQKVTDPVGAIELFVESSASFGDETKMQSLAKLAFTDSETGLPNRNYLDTKIETVKMESEKRSDSYGIILIRVAKPSDMDGDNYLKIIKNVVKTINNILDVEYTLGRWSYSDLVCMIPFCQEKVFEIIKTKIERIAGQLFFEMNGKTVEPKLQVTSCYFSGNYDLVSVHSEIEDALKQLNHS